MGERPLLGSWNGPVLTHEVELSGQLAPLVVGRSASGVPYAAARVLVRLHGAPLGFVGLPLPERAAAAGALAKTIETELGAAVKDHLLADGIQAGALTGSGPAAVAVPPCRDGLDVDGATATPASVVIATRDRPERLAACLRTVLAQTYPHFEVVVVDNAPRRPETKERLRAEFGDDARVRYVREDRAGTSRARNRGVAAARHAHLAFLDDDLDVDREWLARIMRTFARHPLSGCVTGLIVPAELETPAQVRLEQYGGFTKGFATREYARDDQAAGILHPYTAGRLGSGANMAFRRDALEAIGGFDRALGGGTLARGGEDLAAFVMTLLAGYTVTYEPSAIVRHFHHRDDERLRRILFNYGVGLGAYLAKVVYERPGRLADIAGRLGPGLVYLLAPSSAKNARKGGGYPLALTALELAGLAAGPYAYLVGRSGSRRNRPTGRVAR